MAKSNFESKRRRRGNSPAKKALATLSAFAIMAASGTYVADTFGLIDAIKGTSISGPEQPGEANEDKEKTYVAQPFDINDDAAVEKRAKEILKVYKNADMYLDFNIKTRKKVELKDIKNIIYILNDKYDKITLVDGWKDVQKYEYLEWLKKFMMELFATNTIEEVDILSGASNYDISKMSTDNYIWGTEVYATADTNKDLYEQMANLVITQVDLKKNGKDRAELEANAEKFYDLYKSVVDNKELSQSVRLGLLQEAGGKAGHFTPYLSKEKAKYIDKNNQRIVDNRTFDEIYDRLGLDPDALDCMTKQNTTIPFGKSYNAGDAARANAAAGGSQKESKVVDEGGKHQGTVKKGKKGGKVQGTTSTTVYTTVPKTNPENGKTVPQTSKHKEETSKGGQPVGTTKKEVIEDPKATTTTTTKPKTTTTTTLKYEEPEMVWDDEINASANYDNVPTAVATARTTSESKNDPNYVVAIVAGAVVAGGAIIVAKRKYKDSERLKVNSNTKILKK